MGHENFLAVTSKPLSQTFGAAKVSEAEQACADAGLVNDKKNNKQDLDNCVLDALVLEDVDILPRFLPRFSFSSFKPSQKKKTTKQQKQSIRNQRHQNNLPYIQTHNYIVNRILNIIIRFLQTRCMILLFIPNK